MTDGLVQSALVLKSDSEAPVGKARRAGFEPDGFLEVADGLVQPTLGAQGLAEVGVSQSRIRVEPEGFLVMADGLVRPAQGIQNSPKVDVNPGRRIRVDAEGFLEVVDGLVQPALFEEG